MSVPERCAADGFFTDKLIGNYDSKLIYEETNEFDVTLFVMQLAGRST